MVSLYPYSLGATNIGPTPINVGLSSFLELLLLSKMGSKHSLGGTEILFISDVLVPSPFELY